VRLRDTALALVIAACRRHEPQPHTHEEPVAADAIPKATAPIVIDGEWNEPDWSQRALRGQFVGDDGALARPSSEVRLLHDETDLLVALYAADENIETRDAFDLTIGTQTLHVDATGALTPANTAIRAKVDYDEGTRDNPKDDDEEWVVELAIPLSVVQLHTNQHVKVFATRCDIPKDNVQRCGHWSGSLTLE
jgi:hypothetical protein